MASAITATVAALVIGPSAEAAPNAGHFRLALDRAAQTADYTASADRNNYVILQGYQVPLMQRLKEQNPKLKVLVYKDLSAMVERDQWGGVSTGVATQDAAGHPEWFLKNTSGNRFTFRHYDWMWAADIGDSGFQQKWADNVLAEVKAKGWDGVFMDDVNPSIEFHYDVASVAKYPTDAAYQNATGSALAAIGARFRAEDKLVIPNFGFWKDHPNLIKSWLRHVDGGMNEMFVKVGSTRDGYDSAAVWETQLQSIKDAQTLGKAFLGISHSPNDDRAAGRYGYATMLLGGDGNAHFAMHGDYANENWFPEYDYEIGTAVTADTREAYGVHRRRFSDGLVLVNPTGYPVRVAFGGRYSGSGLSNASAATMAPRSALVLTKAGGDAPKVKSRRAKAAKKRKRLKAKAAKRAKAKRLRLARSQARR
jgi:hypothetical protein